MATLEEMQSTYKAQVPNSGAATTPAPTQAAPTKVNTTVSTGGTYGQGQNMINSMYDAQRDARLNELKSGYEQSKSEHIAAQGKIAPQYQSAANALAVEAERNKRNFNLQAAANGLNTGAGGQAALAQNSAYQRDYGGLRTAEADAQAEAARQLANLEAKYQSDVASALANNDYQRAAAMYDEFKNSQNQDMQKAQILAEFGDFSGYASLYGQESADNMFRIWAIQNPELAYSVGKITKQQRDNIKSGRYMDEVRSSGSGSGGDPWAYGGAGWNPGYQLTPSDNIDRGAHENSAYWSTR